MNTVTSLAEAFYEISMMDAPLKQRLAAYAGRLRELNRPFAEAYDRLVARLEKAKVGEGAPGIGEIMPSFVLPDQNGKLISLEELTRSGRVVISFNRGHWCPFCKLELRGLADSQSKFAEDGASVVSIMPERELYTRRAVQELDERINILSDIDNGFALSIGLVMWVGDEVMQLMQGRGFDLNEFQGNNGWFLPVPATFIVDHTGRIIARSINPDFRTRMEIDEIIRALRQ